MIEESLKIKYRPKVLDEIVGNEQAKKQIQGILKTKGARSLLFLGLHGTGKTTFARCIAHELGAYNPKKSLVANPNYEEINANSFGGIDVAREIEEKAKLVPMGKGKCRVFFIDECHELSSKAQNALLHQIEHPGKRTWYILATTEPQKLIKTIKDRCTTIHTEVLTSDKIQPILSQISKKEGYDFDKKTLRLIAEKSEGRMRQALNFLETVAILDPSERPDAIHKLAITETLVIDLCRALMKKAKWKDVTEILKKLEDHDAESIRRQVLGYFRKVMLNGKESCYLIMSCFAQNYYDVGHAGLVMSCYEALEAGE